jgi:hypothetical protein
MSPAPGFGCPSRSTHESCTMPVKFFVLSLKGPFNSINPFNFFNLVVALPPSGF